MEYSDVSKRYPVFYYHDFAIIESDDELDVQFDFEIEGLSHFNPEFILTKPAGGATYANLRTVREAAFSLGLMELISYWKLTCAPTVIVECGQLDSDQISPQTRRHSWTFALPESRSPVMWISAGSPET